MKIIIKDKNIVLHKYKLLVIDEQQATKIEINCRKVELGVDNQPQLMEICI